MNSIAGTPKNQEDGSSSGRRKFMKMLGFAAGAGVATAVAAIPAAAAPAVAEPEEAHPFGRCENPPNMERDYNQHMLAHMCLMAELMREWFRANSAELYLACPEIAGDLYDLSLEAKMSARTLAKSAGITLDQSYITSRIAEYKARAMGGAA